jgi:hypothetical protein
MPFRSGRSGCRFRPRGSRSGVGISGATIAHCSSVMSFAMFVLTLLAQKSVPYRLKHNSYFEMGSRSIGIGNIVGTQLYHVSAGGDQAALAAAVGKALSDQVANWTIVDPSRPDTSAYSEACKGTATVGHGRLYGHQSGKPVRGQRHDSYGKRREAVEHLRRDRQC